MLILNQAIKDYTYINIITRYPDWTAGNTYVFGDIAFYNQYYYKSVTDDNIGNTPDSDSLHWLRWSVSNRFAQIDLQARTTTICDSSTKVGGTAPYTLVSEFQNNRYDAIALGGVFASSILVEIVDSLDAVVFSVYEDLTNRRNGVVDWFTYYYEPFPVAEEVTAENFFYRLDVYDNTHTIRVTLEESAGRSECSYMICGNTEYVGDTLYGLNLGLIDYSSKEVDDFGILELRRRESRQTMDINVVYDAARINQVNRLVRATLGKVALFINDEDTSSNYENLLLLGLVDNFTTVLSNSVKIEASIGLEEVI